MKKLTCIIPAFNEEKQIANVLDAVLDLKQTLPLEIIVVDDGSTDQTATLLKNYKNIHVITNRPNLGKSYSIAKALGVSKGDYILLLDADLIGLTANDIRNLLLPIQNNTAEVTMSVRRNSFMHMRIMNLDFVTGERVFPRRLVADKIDEIKKLPRFGLEVFLNNLIIEHRCVVKTVYWKTVAHTKKNIKRGFFSSIVADIKMARDILQTVSLPRIAMQHVALIKQSTRNND